MPDDFSTLPISRRVGLIRCLGGWAARESYDPRASASAGKRKPLSLLNAASPGLLQAYPAGDLEPQLRCSPSGQDTAGGQDCRLIIPGQGLPQRGAYSLAGI